MCVAERIQRCGRRYLRCSLAAAWAPYDNSSRPPKLVESGPGLRKAQARARDPIGIPGLPRVFSALCFAPAGQRGAQRACTDRRAMSGRRAGFSPSGRKGRVERDRIAPLDVGSRPTTGRRQRLLPRGRRDGARRSLCG